MWNVYHFKGDQRPFTQHRYLWHTPIVGAGIIALFYFGLPKGDYTIFTNIKNSINTKQLGYFFMNNAVLILFIFLAFMCILVGSHVIITNLRKLFPVIPGVVKYIFPAVTTIYMVTTNYSNLRIMGICLGVGYLLHCLEDFFADTGIPLIWPIPKFWGTKKVWWRPWLPFRVTTGGMVNTIIDFVSFTVAVGLFIFVFMK